LDRVDLIDLDISGQELVTPTAAVADLSAKVKRVHILQHAARNLKLRSDGRAGLRA
jgi:hypothetical protein